MEAEAKDSYPKIGSAAEAVCREMFAVLKAHTYGMAKSKGWWPDDMAVNHGEQIALMHSELSEALEWLRNPEDNTPSDHIPEFTGLEEELADVIIRIMSYAGRMDLKIGEAVLAKIRYNAGRSHMHGGKNF